MKVLNEIEQLKLTIYNIENCRNKISDVINREFRYKEKLKKSMFPDVDKIEIVSDDMTGLENAKKLLSDYRTVLIDRLGVIKDVSGKQ